MLKRYSRSLPAVSRFPKPPLMPGHLPFVPDPPDIGISPILSYERRKTISRLNDPENFVVALPMQPRSLRPAARRPGHSTIVLRTTMETKSRCNRPTRQAECKNRPLSRTLHGLDAHRGRRRSDGEYSDPDAGRCRPSDPSSKRGSVSGVAEQVNCTWFSGPKLPSDRGSFTQSRLIILHSRASPFARTFMEGRAGRAQRCATPMESSLVLSRSGRPGLARSPRRRLPARCRGRLALGVARAASRRRLAGLSTG
jgi:hypothetical protein